MSAYLKNRRKEAVGMKMKKELKQVKEAKTVGKCMALNDDELNEVSGGKDILPRGDIFGSQCDKVFGGASELSDNK